MKNTIALFFIVLAGLKIQCQAQSITQAYDTSTIIQTTPNRYVLNGKKLNRKELGRILLACPASAEEYKAYKKSHRTGNIIFISSAAVYVAGIFMLGENPTAGGITTIASIGGMVSSIPFYQNQSTHLNRAIWLYNRSKILTHYVPV